LFVEICFDFTSPWPAKAVNSAVQVLFVEICFDFPSPLPAKAVNEVRVHHSVKSEAIPTNIYTLQQSICSPCFSFSLRALQPSTQTA
jgi:hypothetical protein